MNIWQGVGDREHDKGINRAATQGAGWTGYIGNLCQLPEFVNPGWVVDIVYIIIIQPLKLNERKGTQNI